VFGGAASLPAVGQLVHVRQRRFVVTEVAPSQLPLSPTTSANGSPAHLLTLSSVDDEGLGEELRVIWELEPGTAVFEQGSLPEPHAFDAPERFDAFLNAIRWGAISSADVKQLQAPFRSGIDIEDYQLDPVVRALRMPRANLLVADDVGLGKTIEAGLVVQELLLRHRARTVLVVCPSSLQIQWRDQMRDKFGLEFRVIDSTSMRELRRTRGLHVNPWAHFPRLVTSIDFLKRDRPLRLFRELLPAEGEPAFPRRFDLLIVDEAHNIAPSGSGHYATDSLRTAAIRTLAPHFEHKLFLTATPHNGYRESFTALLELLDNQRFARGVEPDSAQLSAVMVRRLKRELPPRWDESAATPAP
jgi:SNF2 family DNA or RNA helicase